MNFNGISRSQIESLVKWQGNQAVTLYIPTARKGVDVTQGPLKLKNLLVSAEHQLIEGGMRATLARDLLEEASKLVTNSDFWQTRSDGLAIFIGDGHYHIYRLAFEVPELVQVGQRFNVLPLVPGLTRGNPHYVLALDRQHIRLLLCSPEGVTEAKVENLPETMDGFLASAYSEKQAQAHTVGAVGRAGGVVMHGAGDRGVEQKEQTHQFCLAIHEALRHYLHGAQHPLVLAGTEEIVDEYRDVSKYAHTVPDSIVRSLKTLSNSELRDLSQPIVDGFNDRARLDTLERYRTRAGTGLTSRQLETMPEMAQAGRLESLLVSRTVIADNPNESDHTLTPDCRAINDLALETLAHQGNVFLFNQGELFVDEPAVAVLRY